MHLYKTFFCVGRVRIKEEVIKVWEDPNHTLDTNCYIFNSPIFNVFEFEFHITPEMIKKQYLGEITKWVIGDARLP